MANAWVRDRATPFYVSFGLLGLLVVALGFGVTYAVPMVRGTFAAPWFVHLHGASALGAILLFIVQAKLVRGGRTPLHRRLGQGALPLALVVWTSGIATAAWAAKRDVVELGTVATSSLAGTATGLSLYFLLAIAAFCTRRRPDWHKRLAMLTTVQLLWPAFFRLRHLLPMVPKPEISFALILAYLPILIAALRDQGRYGKVHPVWLFIGPGLIIEQSLEVALFDQGPQRWFGEWLYSLLST